MAGWIAGAAIVALLAVVAAMQSRKKSSRARDEASGVDRADSDALQNEGRAALLTRDRSRYARNFAEEMLDVRATKAARAVSRDKYEAAKTRALIEALSIRDDFNRGLASHGIIDLLLAGGEVEPAVRLFATVDAGVRDSIIATDPQRYAILLQGL